MTKRKGIFGLNRLNTLYIITSSVLLSWCSTSGDIGAREEKKGGACIQLCWVIVMDWPELQIAEVEFDCSERKSRRGHLLFLSALKSYQEHYSRPIPHPTTHHPASSILPTPPHPIHITPPIPPHLTPLHSPHPIRIPSHPTPTTAVDDFLACCSCRSHPATCGHNRVAL